MAVTLHIKNFQSWAEADLTAEGYAIPVQTPKPIGGYLVWRLMPGTTVLGVHTVARSGPRPLGTGI